MKLRAVTMVLTTMAHDDNGRVTHSAVRMRNIGSMAGLPDDQRLLGGMMATELQYAAYECAAELLQGEPGEPKEAG